MRAWNKKMPSYYEEMLKKSEDPFIKRYLLSLKKENKFWLKYRNKLKNFDY